MRMGAKETWRSKGKKENDKLASEHTLGCEAIIFNSLVSSN